MPRRKPVDDSPDHPRPFGVDYVPKPRRIKAGKSEVFVCRVDELPPGKARQVPLEKYKVAVFNIRGSFHAIKDACPHAEYPLSKGTLDGEIVMCASHNWRFNVTTGRCVRGETDLTVKQFKVEVRDGGLWLKL